MPIENIGAQLGLGGADLKTILIQFIQLGLGISTLITLIWLMLGGLRWITSGSSDELRDRAQKTIIRAIFGQIIILLAWTFVVWVARVTSQTTFIE